MFNEGGPQSPYGARDVRYVRKDQQLHALLLGWPDDDVARMPLLGTGTAIGRGTVDHVTLPGDHISLPFRRTDQTLEVDLPLERRNAIGLALIVTGHGLTEGSAPDPA